MMAPLSAMAAVAAMTAGLAVRDPHHPGSWGFCPFLAFTGHFCPGCGGLRAVNNLTHGDVLAALSSNLYFVALFPAVIVVWALWMRSSWRGQRWHLSVRTTRTVLYPIFGLLLILLVTFTVLRNTSTGSWLAP